MGTDRPGMRVGLGEERGKGIGKELPPLSCP